MVVVPKTMRAVVQTGYGSPETVIKIVETGVPKLLADEILIKVEYASINPIDWKIMYGKMQKLISIKFPKIIGCDYSGTIVGLGSSVNNYEMGDNVYGNIGPKSCGTFAEYIAIKPTPKTCHKMPKMLSFAEAASIPLVTETSYEGLINKGSLKKGQNILILGGSTACGLLGIEIAKAVGAKNIVVTSRNEELCKSLGATYVIDYTKDDWEKIIKSEKYKCLDKNEKEEKLDVKSNFTKFDIVYDCIGGKDSWDKARNILKLDKKIGKYITIVGDSSNNKSQLNYSDLIQSGLKILNRKFWGWTNQQAEYIFYLASSNKLMWDKINYLINNKQIKAILDCDSPFKFNNVLKLIKKSIDGKAHGKLVLRVSKSKEETCGNNNKIENEEQKDDKI